MREEEKEGMRVGPHAARRYYFAGGTGPHLCMPSPASSKYSLAEDILQTGHYGRGTDGRDAMIFF